MKISKQLILILYFFSVICPSHGQDNNYIPPSPEASALMEYVSVPVNLYSGIPEIDLQLYNFKTPVIDLPITISYHASGIKVQEIASNLGLGWVLNCGGAITRVVRGLPDEHINGYLNNDFESSINVNNYDEIGKNEIDVEPDMFFFNFLGNTGKMLFAEDGSILSLPEQNYKIVPPNFSNNLSWVITDMKGIQYVFGQSTTSREISKSKLQHEGIEKLKTYISTWYLSEIRFGSHIISFQYKSGANIYTENHWETKNDVFFSTSGMGCDPPYIYTGVVKITQELTVEPKYIDKIIFGEQSVDFAYASDRIDLENGRRIIGFDVLNNQATSVKSIEFKNDSYFFVEFCSVDKCFRLKLDKVVDTTGAKDIELYNFSYDYTNLPIRDTHQTDHWGYYNNNQYSNSIPAGQDPLGNVYPGADKSPNLEKTRACVLTSIRNALGGYTNFTYQLNDYLSNGSNTSTGGLRIASISKKKDMSSNEIIRNFSYVKRSNQNASSGIQYREPKYSYWISNKQYCGTSYWQQAYLVRNSHALLDLFDLGGRNVGYSEVTVEYSDGGSEYFQFTNFQDHPDDPPTMGNPLYNDPDFPIDFSDIDGPPYLPLSDRSYERGLIKLHEIYAGENLISSISNTYDFNLMSSKEVKGFRLQFMYANGSSTSYKSGVYTYSHRSVTPKKRIESQYSNGTGPIVKTIDYTYNQDLLQVKKQVSSSTNDIIHETKYPNYNYGSIHTSNNEGNTILEMRSRHMLDYPVEVITKKDIGGIEFVTGCITNEYTWFKNLYSTTLTDANILISKIHELNIDLPITNYTNISYSSPSTVRDGRFSVKALFNYDIYGNVISTQPGETNIVFSYLWGYNDILPIARIENAINNGDVIIEGTIEEDVVTHEVYSWGSGVSLPISGLIVTGKTQDITISYHFARETPDTDSYNLYFSIGSQHSSTVTLGSSDPFIEGNLTIYGVPPGTHDFAVSKAFETVVNGDFYYEKRVITPTQSFARAKEVLFESFEEHPSKTNATTARTGDYYFEGSFDVPLEKILAGDYLLSYWTDNGSGWIYNEESISVISDLSGGTKTYRIGATGLKLDDVRLHPLDAQMTTYTYDPLVGMTSRTDPSGITTYYEYDDFGRLRHALDSEGNVVKQYHYHYASQQ
ncbi:MAG: RHS repeat protein [Cytophagales bacterium]|nr:RHS repeat protein [Cytophagales bacterium]